MITCRTRDDYHRRSRGPNYGPMNAQKRIRNGISSSLPGMLGPVAMISLLNVTTGPGLYASGPILPALRRPVILKEKFRPVLHHRYRRTPLARDSLWEAQRSLS